MKCYFGNFNREIEVLDRADLSGNILKVRFKDTNEIKNVHSAFIKYKEEEIMEKIEIGTKVVPQKKSYGCRLEDCQHWKRFKNKEQDFLYVVDIKHCDGLDLYILNSKKHGWSGNYYLRKDFTILKEEEIKEKEEKLFYGDIDRNLEVDLDECETFSIELISYSKEDLFEKIKNGESIVTIDISPEDKEYDPHFDLENLKELHKWIGDILNYVEQENKPKEMTLEEIEKELGFKVIIKG